MNLLDGYWAYDRNPKEKSKIAAIGVQTRIDHFDYLVSYNEGQFTLSTGLGQKEICDLMIEKSKKGSELVKVSQDFFDSEFKNIAVRQTQRDMFERLCNNGVYEKKGKHKVLTDNHAEAYATLKTTLGW